MWKYSRSLFALCAVAALMLGACKKDDGIADPPAATTGKITGHITDYTTGEPVGAVLVSSVPPSQSVTASSTGLYSMEDIVPGIYNLVATKNGYEPGYASVAVQSGKITIADIVLKPSTGGTGNRPPQAPTNVSPSDRATVQAGTVTLQWDCSDPDGDALKYSVFAGTANPPTTPLVTNSSSKTATFTAQAGATYYWYVVATDSKGASMASGVWRFTATVDSTNTGNGNALYFDGDNDYCLVPYASDFELDEGSFTLEAWIKPTVMTHWDCILTRGVSDDDADFLMILDLNRLRGQSRNLNNLVYGVRTMTPNTWYHVAVVQDVTAGTMSLYVDGVLDKVESLKGAPRAPRNNVFIGAREYFGTGNPCEGFAGFLREMRVWNVARTSTQLNATRKSTLTGNETGLVAYWPMNESSGSTINDKSGRGHAGAIKNGAMWSNSSLPF